jgi:predicted ATPase
MIHEIHVRNFRSIKDLSLKLQHFNCFVGPNNSGKSNLFDVFTFLSDMASRSLDFAVNARNAKSLRYYGAKEDEPVEIALTIEPHALAPTMKLQYRLAFFPVPSPYLLKRESLSSLAEDGRMSNLFSLENRDDGSSKWVVVQGGASLENGGGIFGDSAMNLLMAPSSLRDAYQPFQILKSYFRRLRGFKVVPDRLKAMGQAFHVETLAKDGSNFASYLHTIQSGNPKYFKKVEEQLVKNFPEIEELLSPLAREAGGMTEVAVKEKWFKRAASGPQLSDGLLGFLAHLVILYGPDEPTFVSFEEPENYINPLLLERLVAMLKEASTDVQIAISTHSTSLLNYLHLEDILLVERDKGATTVRKVSESKDLRSALEGWALGDAYVSGVLTGDA